MSLAERISSGVKAFFGARVLYALANAVLLFALTRYLLEPAAYGLLYFAISILSIVTLFGTFGLPKSTGRYVTEFSSTDPSQVPHVVRVSLAALLALSTATAIGLAVVHAPLAALLATPALVPFLLVGTVYVSARALFTYLTNVFQGFNRVDYSALLSATNGLTRVVFAIGFVLLGFGAVGALAGYVAGYAFGAVVGLVVLWRGVLPEFETASDRAGDLVRRILEYSVPTAATRVSVILDSRVDKVLLGILVGPLAVGYYTLAAQIADFCVVPAQSLGFTISPAIGEQSAGDRPDRAAMLYERSMESVLLLYLPAAVGLVLVAEPAIPILFGTDYAGAIPVLQLFGVFVVVRAIHKITGNGLDYLGLARIRAIARGTTALGNVGLNLLLIPPFGVVGAAVATIVTYSLYTAINVYYVHRELDLRVGYLVGKTARIAAIALVMGAVVFVAVSYVSGLLTLVATVLLGVAVWSGLAIASGLLDVAEVRSFLA